jgi:hypothetical protein
MRCFEGDASGKLPGVTLLETHRWAEKILPATVDMQFEFNYHGHA